jgi:hypothetical protein
MATQKRFARKDLPIKVTRGVKSGAAILTIPGLFLRVGAVCMLYVISRKTLCFGRISPVGNLENLLGNLENLLEVASPERPKFRREWAIPRRSWRLQRFGFVVAHREGSVRCGATDDG